VSRLPTSVIASLFITSSPDFTLQSTGKQCTLQIPTDKIITSVTMAELAFCKTFLTALDARPAKLSSDHIADARQFPAQGAVRPSIPYPSTDHYLPLQSLFFN
jgi:hypothetical protein